MAAACHFNTAVFDVLGFRHHPSVGSKFHCLTVNMCCPSKCFLFLRVKKKNNSSFILDLHLGAECDHQFAFMILATLTTGWGEPQASQGTFCWYGYEDLVLFCHDCTFLKKKRERKTTTTGIPLMYSMLM